MNRYHLSRKQISEVRRILSDLHSAKTRLATEAEVVSFKNEVIR
jgi:hypothetical protein